MQSGAATGMRLMDAAIQTLLDQRHDQRQGSLQEGHQQVQIRAVPRSGLSTPRRIAAPVRRHGIIWHDRNDAESSSPARCPTPTAPFISATSSRPCKPTSGCGSRSCAATNATTSCADDTHGTPIMLKAQAEGITPEAADRAGQRRASARPGRHADRHRQFRLDALAGEPGALRPHVPARCARRGYIDRRSVRQAYDDTAKMFLPDRYVKGICPVCGTAGSIRRLLRELRRDLYARRSQESHLGGQRHAAGVARIGTLFLPAERLRAASGRLGAAAARCRRASRASSRNGSRRACKDWDISRDAPYFGFEIPDAPGKYFYVWFDAPIGYLGSFTQLCARTRLEVRRFPRGRIRAPNCITSSARTFCIFIRCSGRRCSKAPACAGRPRCTRTAS